jgi:hypothetical protein
VRVAHAITINVALSSRFEMIATVVGGGIISRDTPAVAAEAVFLPLPMTRSRRNRLHRLIVQVSTKTDWGFSTDTYVTGIKRAFEISTEF